MLTGPLPFPDDVGRRAVLGWASAVGGVLAYQWSKPIPTSLKIIHARVYAQVCSRVAYLWIRYVPVMAPSCDVDSSPSS